MSISDDGDYIFFSSNRPGGHGGLDIYVSQRQRDGNWGEPINLGSAINTPYDEDAPFLQSESNTLYFSSRGHDSMGGYDLFRTTMESITWTNPQNLRWPINTADDDIYFTIAANGLHGYYASAKEGGLGEKDIYMVKFPVDSVKIATALDTNAIAAFVNPASIWLAGSVKDAAGKPLPARLTLVRYDDESKGIQATADQQGNFRVPVPSGFQYGLAVQHPGFLFYSESLALTGVQTGDTLRKTITLKPVAVGASVVLRNIQFAVNKAVLNPESEVELQRVYQMLTENPTMRIELAGHTDNTGPAAYNVKLSRERAQAVVNFLVKKGIAASRLKAVGLGSAKPLAPNTSEEGRQLNRRTEFRILQK